MSKPIVAALLAVAAIPLCASAEPGAGGPMGVSWGVIYGFPPVKAEKFMPQVRALGASFSRLTLYWSQLEPKQGVARWDDLDAFTDQLQSPEEGLLTIASASPWATRTKAWVFPSSPAADPQAYYAFVRRVVEHAKGRIRYFQADNEPSNRFFWAGSAADYAAQQRIFYRAVKDADPNAVVVLGGCDGLFDPSGADPLPGQEANLAFLATMLDQSQGAFDLFDLHLYADPYTIPARVETVRKAMQKAGAERPVIAAEYAGPGFFEFKANRKWFAAIQGPGAGPESVRKLRAEAQAMPIETRMFLARDDDADRRKLLRLQTEDLVVRNMLAFASGVRRTAFFDVWHELRDPDAPNDILFGSLKLLDHGANGLDRELPIAASYRRLATALAGMSAVSRLTIAGHDDVYAFRVERHAAGPLLVAWRRPAQRGGDAEPLRIDLPWQGRPHHVEAADGGAVTVSVAAHALSLEVTDMPVLIG